MIHIQNGLLQTPEKLIKEIPHRSCAIIADSNVAKIYGHPLLNALLQTGLRCFLFSFPPGDQSKTREMKERLENSCFENGLGSDTTIIALGGGVTTDLAGFIAATYCRGVPFISIPTSLLAMCDAAIGGKTGVNCPFGKNMIGCFYEPKSIFIDPEVLKTLPPVEIKTGLVEVIKHAIILSPELFDYLENHAEEILKLQSDALDHIIYESIRIKQDVVRQSKEMRNLLNFGRTIGHALECLSDYSLSHGEAVATGIMVESEIAHQLGIMPGSVLDRIENLLQQYGIATHLDERYSIESIMDKMILDKKSINGKPRFVMVADIGKCLECDLSYCQPISEEIVRAALLGRVVNC